MLDLLAAMKPQQVVKTHKTSQILEVADETSDEMETSSSQGSGKGGATRKPQVGPKKSRSNRSGLQFPVGR